MKEKIFLRRWKKLKINFRTPIMSTWKRRLNMAEKWP
jgi:hypothetical protein